MSQNSYFILRLILYLQHKTKTKNNMGFTDINVKNIRPTSDANSALVLGDFTRGSSIPTEVRNVAELDARFGTGTTNGYNTAKALLEKNIALRVARYDIANSTPKAVVLPTTAPKITAEVMRSSHTATIQSMVFDDGISNILTASYTSIAVISGATIRIIVPENLLNKLKVGDSVELESTFDDLNDGTCIVTNFTVAGSVTTITATADFTPTAETTNTTDGVLKYRNRAVIPSLTFATDLTNLLALNTSKLITLSGVTLSYTSAVYSTNTVVTLPTSANIILSINPPIAATFELHNKTVIAITTTSLGTLSTTNVAYSIPNSNVVTPVGVQGSAAINPFTWLKLDTTIPNVVAGDDVDIYFIGAPNSFAITTTGKGDYSDISLQVTAIQGGRVLVKVYKDATLIDSVITSQNITESSVADFNSKMSLVYIDNSAIQYDFPNFYVGDFTDEAQLFATLGEKNSTLAASKLYSDKFSIAIIEDSNMDLTPYKNDGRVTLFMSLSNYTLLNASAIANTLNDYYNLQLVYGKLNGVDILNNAVAAYIAKQRINPNHPYTRKEYDSVGMGGTLQDTTYFDYATVEELARLGLVTIYTEYGVGSEMRLTNNVTPFADAPLSRHNVASTVQNIAKFMSDMAYAAKDFDLDFKLTKSFNAQVFAFLKTIDALESFTIFDDANAGSVATLTYNNATDFRAGRYKMGLDLLFKGTLVKFTVNFTVR